MADFPPLISYGVVDVLIQIVHHGVRYIDDSYNYQ